MDIDKVAYSALCGRLDFRPSALALFAILAFDAGLLWLWARLAATGSVVNHALSQIVLAIVFFNAFSLLHECGHGSAARSRAANALLGHLASTFCLIPYYPWKYIHKKHHHWAGNLDHDPVLKSLRKFRDRGVPTTVRFAWRSWLPLGSLMQHFVYLTYPHTMWKEGDRALGEHARNLISLLWLPTSYGLLWATVPELRLSTVVPAFVLFLFAEELVNLPHHVGMPATNDKLRIWEQHRVTRSCNYPHVVSELLVLNFNFHIEHHLFPSLPWYRLRQARRLIKPLLAERYHECTGIEWNVRERKHSLETIVAAYRGNSA